MTTRRLRAAALVVVPLLAAGCTDEIPTSSDPALIPITVETFEVSLSFSEFAEAFRVDGGYGSPAALSVNRILLEEEDGLEIRPLYRFAGAPAVIQVFPEGATQTVPDSLAVPIGGRVTVVLDTVPERIRGVPPFEVRADATTETWDPATASWTHAVDTLGARQPWSEPGGGAVRPLGTGLFDPEDSNSLTFELDSLTASEWAPSQNMQRGLRLSLTEPNTGVRVQSAAVELDLRSDVNPDTVVTVNVPAIFSTMIFDAQVDTGQGQMLVGGAPAFRSTFRFELPDSVEVSGAICGDETTCRVALTAERVIFAGLAFQSAPTSPISMAPRDALVLDLRPVLAPDRLPRSPLGTPVLPEGRTVGPEIFEEGGETMIEIPATRLVRDILRGPPEGSAAVAPSTVSLISASEPSGIGVATFAGPGSPGSPILRIILTASEGVSLP